MPLPLSDDTSSPRSTQAAVEASVDGSTPLPMATIAREPHPSWHGGFLGQHITAFAGHSTLKQSNEQPEGSTMEGGGGGARPYPSVSYPHR